MKEYNNKIHWNLAGAFARFKEISGYAISNNLLRHYDKVTVYDGLNHCVWNGGRLHYGITYDSKIHQFYKKLGWGIKLTFTNYLITDLSDDMGNWLLETFHEEGNGIILVNEDLRRYVHKNFPKYNCCNPMSCTKSYFSASALAEEMIVIAFLMLSNL